MYQLNNMTDQPNDVPHWSFDQTKFNRLNVVLSFPDESQVTTTELDIVTTEISSSKLDEINENTQDSSITPILAPTYGYGTQSSIEFDESELMDPMKKPINEVTITTTTNNSENGTWRIMEMETSFRQLCDQIRLKNVDDSIKKRTMSVETQPPSDLRPRYKSDGKRQIEKSRTTPMAVKLPDLKAIQLEPDEQFLLRLMLVTYNPDHSTQTNLHPNKLEYHSNDVQELDDGTVCVVLAADDKEKGRKSLPRLSIVRTKLGSYKSELAPLCLSNNEVYQSPNTDESEKVAVKSAKNIRDQYNLGSSRIICQLLIKQNESIHYTDIMCETHVLHEKKQENSTNKRSASCMESDDDSIYEPPSRSKSKRRR